MVRNLSNNNSVLNQIISELRDVNVQKDSMKFRRNIERAGGIMAYELSKTLEYVEKSIETPLGIAKIQVPGDELVIATILRAGLPLHQGILNYFDKSESAFISAYRVHHKDGTFEIKTHYITSPSIEGKVLVVTDPMLATGSSLEKSMEAILEYGKPKRIHLVTVIASTYGLNHVKRLYPKMDIWMAALDEELTAKSYIVPGLGDAGDLCFGSKGEE